MITIYHFTKILIDLMINQLPEKLKYDITEYCRVNNIQDTNSFILKLIRQAFTTEKFGSVPEIFRKKNEVEIVVEETIKEEPLIPVIDEIVKDNDEVKKYEIDIDLKKEEIKIVKPPIKVDDDIYGEGKTGWFGNSNLYDIIKGKNK
jgi:hypothetical protein